MPNPNEDELLAELDKLEKSTIRKGGDALQNAPHDGGFATEGTNIQAKAKKMAKALIKQGYSKKLAKALAKKAFADDDSTMSSDDDSSVEKGEGYSSDDDSSSVEKAMGSDDDSMSSDDASGDDESSDGASSDEASDDGSSEAPMNKSLGAAQLANASGKKGESLRKAIVEEHPDMQGAFDAAPVLGQLIDSIDRLAKKTSGPSKKDLGDLRKSIVAIDNRQNSFNGKIAKALSMIAGRIIETENLVKKMASEPIANNRQPTLRKGDLHEPSFHGNDQAKIGGDGGIGEPSPLQSVPYLQVQEWLTDLCMKGQAELMDITKFENSKGDLRLLPPNVIKQLEQRCAA